MAILVEDWYKRAEEDFFMMFVRQWIPFNAWFMDEYERVRGVHPNDRQAIDFLKANNNKFRDKIVNLLHGHDAEKDAFFYHLACLYQELNSHPITNRGNRVTLSDIHIENNTVTVKTQNYGHYTYKCEKITRPAGGVQWNSMIMKKAAPHITVCVFTLAKWNLSDFEAHPDYLAIGDEIKKAKLKECYMAINPKKPTDIVLPMRTRNGNQYPPLHSIKVSDSLYVINDAVKVSQVLIELLYILRCQIFHGVLEPKNAYYGIYEHAYGIMRLLNKELV